DGEDFHFALFQGRRLHHGLVAVHAGKADAASAQVGDGAAHRLRHVEELEIDEYLVAALHQPFEQLEVAARHEQLQAELVETRRAPARAPSGTAGSAGDSRCASATRRAHPGGRARGPRARPAPRRTRSREGAGARCRRSYSRAAMAVIVAPASTTSQDRYSQT